MRSVLERFIHKKFNKTKCTIQCYHLKYEAGLIRSFCVLDLISIRIILVRMKGLRKIKEIGYNGLVESTIDNAALQTVNLNAAEKVDEIKNNSSLQWNSDYFISKFMGIYIFLNVQTLKCLFKDTYGLFIIWILVCKQTKYGFVTTEFVSKQLLCVTITRAHCWTISSRKSEKKIFFSRGPIEGTVEIHFFWAAFQ